MNPDITDIKKEVRDILPDIISVRHHLHAHPELSLKEFNTSAYVRERLAGLYATVLPPFLATDVVAVLSGTRAGKNVTLRADMDALPLQEENDNPYCSSVRNVMHACGHDGHTAMLLGAAIVLNKYRDSFSGSVRFVFQPGEEIVAAGKDLVKRGALDDPKPDAVLALHAWPGYPASAVCSRPGTLMAAADIFKLTIKGRGGHGSAPEKTNDPILTAGRVVNRLRVMSSRKMNVRDPLVISVCSIHGGTSANVIPSEVTLNGSVRYLSMDIGRKVPSMMEHAVRGECSYTGADFDLEYIRAYIPTVNNSHIISTCKKVTQDYFGKTSWIDIDKPVMGSEDFSFYIEKNPGAMFFLGMGEESAPLHSNTFDFNDEALKNGILFFVLSTLELLSDNNQKP